MSMFFGQSVIASIQNLSKMNSNQDLKLYYIIEILAKKFKFTSLAGSSSEDVGRVSSASLVFNFNVNPSKSKLQLATHAVPALTGAFT